MIQLLTALEKYSITAKYIYNFDEEGFIIGVSSATKRIMSRGALESRRILSAIQDGS